MELTSRFTEPFPMPKEINDQMCLQVWSSNCSFDWHGLREDEGVLETSRAESAAQGKPEVKEFPKPDARADWKYLDHLTKDRIAA